MRIAVNTRLLLKDRLEGIGWFTYQTLIRMTNEHLRDEFIFLFDRPYDPRFIFSPNVTPVVLMPPTRHPLLWNAFFQYSIPYALKKYKADVFLSPDGFISCHTSVKTINVIHDINFEHHPEYIHQPWQRRFYRKHGKQFAEKATAIATVSEYTKQDIVQTYGIDPDKISVVYNGVNEFFRPHSPEEQADFRHRFTQSCPYFIYVGSIHRRKNIENLLRAFDIYKNHQKNHTKLVIAGCCMWDDSEIKTVVDQMHYHNDVIFTNKIKNEDLAGLMSGAIALTYVSFFEGFGIPIIEAFQAETAVITSHVTSMPEIAGDAALLVNPNSPQAICNAMIEVDTQAELRASLIEKGRQRRSQYSWSATADKLWSLIETVSQ